MISGPLLESNTLIPINSVFGVTYHCYGIKTGFGTGSAKTMLGQAIVGRG